MKRTKNDRQPSGEIKSRFWVLSFINAMDFDIVLVGIPNTFSCNRNILKIEDLTLGWGQSSSGEAHDLQLSLTGSMGVGTLNLYILYFTGDSTSIRSGSSSATFLSSDLRLPGRPVLVHVSN